MGQPSAVRTPPAPAAIARAEPLVGLTPLLEVRVAGGDGDQRRPEPGETGGTPDAGGRNGGGAGHRLADLHLRAAEGSIPVRVRWPGSRAARRPLPVIVFLPQASPGSRVAAADDALAHELCGRVGALVLTVPWAARRGDGRRGLDTAEAALSWAAEHAGELGGDPERLVVGGRGIGAAVAFALALRARDRGWPALVRQLLVLAPHAPTPSPPGDLTFGCSRRLHAAGVEVERLSAEAPPTGSDPIASIGLTDRLLADVAASLRRALSARRATPAEGR